VTEVDGSAVRVAVLVGDAVGVPVMMDVPVPDSVGVGVLLLVGVFVGCVNVWKLCYM
jgi:hypothetical protein